MERRPYVEKTILFAGALYNDPAVFGAAREDLGALFGEILLESHPSPWNWSPYYIDEMGEGLSRSFLFFRADFQPPMLADAKRAANEFEKKFARSGRRRVNLDPGYLTPSKMVLATMKNYSHRLYLGDGVYAELTLFFRDGAYRPLPYTYNEYRALAEGGVIYEARRMMMNRQDRQVRGGRGCPDESLRQNTCSRASSRSQTSSSA